MGFQVQILLQLVLALVLGALIGLEREIADKPAGLRTHMLVAGASMLLVALSQVAVATFRVSIGDQIVRSDPIRILQAVIAGVSFLGAGTIIRRRSEGEVEGLTTAASMLFATAVGVSVALNQYVMAIGATILALVTLRGVDNIERWLDRRYGRSSRQDGET